MALCICQAIAAHRGWVGRGPTREMKHRPVALARKSRTEAAKSVAGCCLSRRGCRAQFLCSRQQQLVVRKVCMCPAELSADPSLPTLSCALAVFHPSVLCSPICTLRENHPLYCCSLDDADKLRTYVSSSFYFSESERVLFVLLL